MILLIHFQTSTAQPSKLVNGWIISSHTLLGIWVLIFGGIECVQSLTEHILTYPPPDHQKHFIVYILMADQQINMKTAFCNMSAMFSGIHDIEN